MLNVQGLRVQRSGGLAWIPDVDMLVFPMGLAWT